jgi:hypothetical protein
MGNQFSFEENPSVTLLRKSELTRRVNRIVRWNDNFSHSKLSVPSIVKSPAHVAAFRPTRGEVCFLVVSSGIIIAALEFRFSILASDVALLSSPAITLGNPSPFPAKREATSMRVPCVTLVS